MLTRTKNDYAHKLLAHIEKVEKHDEQEVEVSVGDDGQLVFWLTEPTSVFGLFGRETQASVIRVAVDEPERLVVHLRNAGKIGRASCRERGQRRGEGVRCKKKASSGAR